MKDLELNHWLMLDDNKKTDNTAIPSFIYLTIIFAFAYIATLILK